MPNLIVEKNLPGDPPPPSIIAVDKNKTKRKSNTPGVIAYTRNPTMTATDGSVVDIDPNTYRLMATFTAIQNKNMFDFLSRLGINSTFKGVDDDFSLRHEDNEALKLEFVCYMGVVNGSSLIMRDPESYAHQNQDGKYNVAIANQKFSDSKGRIVRLESPVTEIFHKNSVIFDSTGNAHLVPEQVASKIAARHDDPYLKTVNGRKDGLETWLVYDQKQPVLTSEPLAVIDRYRGKLMQRPGKVGAFVEDKIGNDEFVSLDDEMKLRRETTKVMLAVDYALQRTSFEHAYFDQRYENGNVSFGDTVGNACLVDGKVEFARKGNSFAVTDDLSVNSMRVVFDSRLDMKIIHKNCTYVPGWLQQYDGIRLQNFASIPEMLLTNAMMANASEKFKQIDPNRVMEYVAKNMKLMGM